MVEGSASSYRSALAAANIFCPEARTAPKLARVDVTSAILLRKTKLTETSLILTWLSADLGIVKTVAKGARAPRSKFAGVLDLFFECEIGFVRSRKSALHILQEAVLKNPHEGLRLDYARVACAAYFVELSELVTEPEHPASELYGLLIRALGHLNEQPASKRALLHFERELTALLGIQQPEVTPAIALERTYHRLPGARSQLLKMLP